MLYRAARRQLQKRKARRDAAASEAPAGTTEVVQGSEDAPPRAPWWKNSETVQNLMLMAALAIPVFLETLDYTG